MCSYIFYRIIPISFQYDATFYDFQNNLLYYISLFLNNGSDFVPIRIYFGSD